VNFPIPVFPLTTLAVAVWRISKLYSPGVADVEAVAVQGESSFAMDANFLSKADSEPSDPTLDFRVETADLTSLSALVRVASSDFSRRKRFCGARLTSMSWSTMPFQSKPDARPDNANPAIESKSESSEKTLENSQTFFNHHPQPRFL
jgi:hypothetical protein